MRTEAQRKASKKYYESHKEYYKMKTNEYMKKTRKERKEYKERCKKAADYIRENIYVDYYGMAMFKKYECIDKILKILEGDKE